MNSPVFNLPNILTFARIFCIPLMSICFFFDDEENFSDIMRCSAVGIFIIASVTDYLDGYFARIWKQTSNFGRMLDPIADKLLVATCLLLLVADRHSSLSGWSLGAAIIILCREILVSGLREHLASLKTYMPSTFLSKWKTSVQMIALSLLLGGPVFDKIFIYSTQIGVYLLWVAAVLTLYTGYDYLCASMKHIKD